MSIADWTSLWIAAALVGAIVATALWRRVWLGWMATISLLSGLVLLMLAAGQPRLLLPVHDEVAVMVDLSPSTRGAAYRERDQLMRRIDELIGDAPRRIIAFAHDHADLPRDQRLADLPADETRFVPVSTRAILLFSDAQFEPPTLSPQVHVVVDPQLERPADAAVTQLDVRSDAIVANVRNSGEQRRLTWSGPVDVSTQTIAQGGQLATARWTGAAGKIVARLDGGDLWPENDALAIRPPPPIERQRWWVGASPPEDGWVHLSPEALPLDISHYLSAAVIVLEDTPAAAVSSVQQRRLMQYVRDLGGAMLIIGGERAFAAGGYAGSTLDTLSPLASHPPSPTRHWMLLADSSGSMAAIQNGATRWRRASDALLAALATLPADDLVSTGSFAAELRWWTSGLAVNATLEQRLPPADVRPAGPTNLEPALQHVAAAVDGGMPAELVLITDAEAVIDQPQALAAALRQRRVRVHVLAIGSPTDDAPLRTIVSETGGQYLAQPDAQRWAQDLRELVQAAAPDYMGDVAVRVQFAAPLESLPPRTVSVWNRTWLKRGAAAFATTADEMPLAARWRVGGGEVSAAAFAPSPAEVVAMVESIARPPRDPRFSVAWQQGAMLRIVVDAVDDGRAMNGLQFVLDIVDESTGTRQSHAIAQTGPGRYENELPSPRSPVIASVRHGGAVIDQRAIAGRYPREFDAIGNNREMMRHLAEVSGGSVIEPDHVGPIELGWPRREVALLPWLALAGAGFLAVGMIVWRRGE